MLSKHFLIKGKTADKLYDFVKGFPIIDYHNHLSLDEINNNKRYTDIYDLWIKPDPYKHRVMRMCGVDERYITGNACNYEKFKAWCEIFPNLIGNQIYIWSEMELEKIFNIKETPNKENAEWLYDNANNYLKDNIITPVSLMEIFNVEISAPCTSVLDDLSVFKTTSVFVPSLRGDDIVNVTPKFIQSLEKVMARRINSLADYEECLKQRLDELEEVGLKFVDHALDNGFIYYQDDGENAYRFKEMLSNRICEKDIKRLSSYILLFLGKEYSKRNLVLQLHIGAQRKTSTKLRNIAGPTGGFAGIGNSVNVESLVEFLDSLDSNECGIPKTVLFTLNPSDNALISALSGSYSKSGVKGLITQGPAWWWCDNQLGIVDVLENTTVFGLLSNFIGMTTDSRSFLSFVRHDYFRRILCSWIGEKIDNGDFICTDCQVKELLAMLCYKNAKDIIY